MLNVSIDWYLKQKLFAPFCISSAVPKHSCSVSVSLVVSMQFVHEKDQQDARFFLIICFT